MNAIGLNPIKLDAIGLDPIRMNAIRLGVLGASSDSGRPYIDPELLSHVKMAISTWGKTNDDPDRTVLKDLSGNGNDMRLLNFGFAENSGYGLYSTDFTTWTKSSKVTSVDYKSFNFDTSANWVLLYHKSNLGKDTPSFKVYINADGALYYNYINQEGILKSIAIKSEDFETPVSYNTLYMGETPVIIGFTASGACKGSITQLPDFEGWLCTDGVDDIIVSVKPVSEMLEGSNEFTVISIIHYINANSGIATVSNNFIGDLGGKGVYARNSFSASETNKTGIYGYTYNIPDRRKTVIGILGDEKDYAITDGINVNCIDEFTVNGFRYSDLSIKEVTQIAYAGGFIANKVLTTDEINQIIAYFNLDRPGQIIKPQLYYNIKKQGITNDNHAEFNDQLIDFVGGHNIQLNNIGWEGESGINSYPVVFGANKTWETYATYNFTSNINGNKLHITKVLNSNGLIFSYVKRNNELLNIKEIPSFDIEVIGLEGESKLQYCYLSEENAANITILTLENGVHKIPKSFIPTDILPNSTWIGFRITPIQEGVSSFDCDITIDVLPTIEHALCLDGINDFGEVTGLPVLKDYTVVALRKWLYGDSATSVETGSIVSKSKANQGAFILEQTLSLNPARCGTWNFGTFNALASDDKLNEESFTYQTRYSYNGNPIQAGTGVDGDTMWIGTVRDGDTRFSNLALWSLMLFPYSLSEFLLERQLRKYKAGTLYPDMIEFRPIVKSNIPYSSISYSVNPGVYVTESSTVTITITLSNASDKLIGVSSNAISDISISRDNETYEITGKVTKSPQKISIVISSYLTMLGNDTLISNETLIKNE